MTFLIFFKLKKHFYEFFIEIDFFFNDAVLHTTTVYPFPSYPFMPCITYSHTPYHMQTMCVLFFNTVSMKCSHFLRKGKKKNFLKKIQWESNLAFILHMRNVTYCRYNKFFLAGVLESLFNFFLMFLALKKIKVYKKFIFFKEYNYFFPSLLPLITNVLTRG